MRKKYHDLLPELAAELESYDKMIDSVDAGLIAEWQKQLDDTHKKRTVKVDVMDTFEVELDKGTLLAPPSDMWSTGSTVTRLAPSKTDIQLELASEEVREGAHVGAAGWITEGMRVQQEQ